MGVIAELARDFEIQPHQSYKQEEAIPCMVQRPLQAAADKAVEGTVSEEPVDALRPRIDQLKVDNGFSYANSADGASRSSTRRLSGSTSATLIFRPFAPSQRADGN
jgi:hypothetical protein